MNQLESNEMTLHTFR